MLFPANGQCPARLVPARLLCPSMPVRPVSPAASASIPPTRAVTAAQMVRCVREALLLSHHQAGGTQLLRRCSSTGGSGIPILSTGPGTQQAAAPAGQQPPTQYMYCQAGSTRVCSPLVAAPAVPKSAGSMCCHARCKERVSLSQGEPLAACHNPGFAVTASHW